MLRLLLLLLTFTAPALAAEPLCQWHLAQQPPTTAFVPLVAGQPLHLNIQCNQDAVFQFPDLGLTDVRMAQNGQTLTPLPQHQRAYLLTAGVATLQAMPVVNHTLRPRVLNRLDNEREAIHHASLFHLYFGAALALSLYSLVLATRLRDRALLYYCTYIGASALFFLSQDGISRLWLPRDHWLVSIRIGLIFAGLTVWAGTLFFCHLLDLARHWLRLTAWVLRPLASITLLLPVTGVVGIRWAMHANVIMTWTALVLIVVLIGSMLVLVTRRNALARYSLLAFLPVFAAFTYRSIFAEPTNFWGQYGVMFASMVEAAILAFAVAYRLVLLQRERRRAIQASLTDPLTGIFNRLGWRQEAERLRLQCQHDQRLFAVFFIDLDHFKAVNDRHGHRVGDRVLQAVVNAICSVCRQDDVCGRYAGDEFVIAAALQEPAQADDIRQRLSERIAHQQVRGAHNDLIAPAATIGMAIADDEQPDLDTLVDRADARMYTQKPAHHQPHPDMEPTI